LRRSFHRLPPESRCRSTSFSPFVRAGRVKPVSTRWAATATIPRMGAKRGMTELRKPIGTRGDLLKTCSPGVATTNDMGFRDDCDPSSFAGFQPRREASPPALQISYEGE
jgi:hypothetical protein